jgi:hypothetical protein
VERLTTRSEIAAAIPKHVAADQRHGVSDRRSAGGSHRNDPFVAPKRWPGIEGPET